MLDLVLSSEIDDLEVISRWNYIKNLSQVPDILPDDISQCTNVTGTTSHFTNEDSESFISDQGSGLFGERSLKIVTKAQTNSGVSLINPAEVLVNGGKAHTFYTLLKGRGKAKILLAPMDSGHNYLAFSYSNVINLTGNLQILQFKKTMESGAVDCDIWWINDSAVTSTIYVLANLLREAPY